MTTEQPEAVSLATIDWRRGKWSSAKGKYSREHTWLLAGGMKLRVSDSESMVPEASRDPPPGTDDSQLTDLRL
jgi:hypothetical protein